MVGRLTKAVWKLVEIGMTVTQLACDDNNWATLKLYILIATILSDTLNLRMVNHNLKNCSELFKISDTAWLIIQETRLQTIGQQQ